MKNFSIFLLALSLFAACTNDTTEDLSLFIPGALKISFDSQSRVELDQNCQTVWTKGDEVGVFYDYYPTLYEYEGETGAKEGILVPKEQVPDASEEVVVVYPYNELNYHDTFAKQIWEVIIPTTQYYRAGSYGVGANIMVGVGTSENIELKSICGWIKLQFTGSEKLTRIALQSNNNEQVSGSISVNYEDFSIDSSSGWITEKPAYVSLDLGDGVQLTDSPTAFYIALIPQTYSKGITVTATADNGTYMTQTTDKEITIFRNTIQPMSSLDYVCKTDIDPTQIPNNEIWYTTTDGNIIDNTWIPIYLGANIISNTYVNGKGIIKTDGNITKIGECAFQNCWNLASITIPDSVTTIENSAFFGCDSLSDITIPDSVTKIGDFAFYDCSNLISITIPNSVTEIGLNPFRSCDNLAEFKSKFASEDGRCLIIDGVLNSFAPARLTEYTIPSGVITIGNSALYDCSHLTNVTIPDSVTNIEEYAFRGCSHLLSIIIPEGVTSIGEAAFAGCNSLVDIIIPDSVTTIESSAFYIDNYHYPISGINSKIENVYINDLSAWCNISFGKGLYESFPWSNPLLDAENLYLNGELVTELIIPNDVTEIKTYAFYDCESLISVTIPDNVTSIGMDAFYLCSNITSVTIGNGVTEIGLDAFRWCTNLRSITIGNNVTLIMDRAFCDCKKLTSVTIPENVTYIGWRTFDGCENLESIYCMCTTPPQIGYDTFDNNAANRKIYVPRTSVDAYKSADGWKEYADAIEPYDF